MARPFTRQLAVPYLTIGGFKHAAHWFPSATFSLKYTKHLLQIFQTWVTDKKSFYILSFYFRIKE